MALQYIKAIIQTFIILGALGLFLSSFLYMLLGIIKSLNNKLYARNANSRVTTFMHRKMFNEESYRPVYVFVLFCAIVFLVIFIFSLIAFGVIYALKIG